MRLRERVNTQHAHLAAFDLPVLDGSSAEALIELNGLVCANSDLVLRTLASQPEVNVPRQAASALDSGKEDVGVALVELAIRLREGWGGKDRPGLGRCVYLDRGSAKEASHES